MSGTLPFSLPLKHLDIIRMFGDAYMKSFAAVAQKYNFERWPTSEQHLVKFQPCDSESSYLIQACDMVSNFMFSLIRHVTGLPDVKYQQKSSVIEQHINLENVIPAIKSSFSIDGTDIICTDQNLWANINPMALG